MSNAEEHKCVKPLHLYEVPSDSLILLVKIEQSFSDDVLNTVRWNEYLLHIRGYHILWLDWCSKHSKPFIAERCAIRLGLIMPAASLMCSKKYWKSCLLAFFKVWLRAQQSEEAYFFLAVINYNFLMQNGLLFFNILQMREVCLYGCSHYVVFFHLCNFAVLLS